MKLQHTRDKAGGGHTLRPVRQCFTSYYTLLLILHGFDPLRVKSLLELGKIDVYATLSSGGVCAGA